MSATHSICALRIPYAHCAFCMRVAHSVCALRVLNCLPNHDVPFLRESLACPVVPYSCILRTKHKRARLSASVTCTRAAVEVLAVCTCFHFIEVDVPVAAASSTRTDDEVVVFVVLPDCGFCVLWGLELARFATKCELRERGIRPIALQSGQRLRLGLQMHVTAAGSEERHRARVQGRRAAVSRRGVGRIGRALLRDAYRNFTS